MSDYLFKWKVGDIIKTSSKTAGYFIIYGMTDFDENKHRYPSYLAKKFGYKLNNKFIGYHTKSFRKSWDDSKWFEGMEYLWGPKKIEKNELTEAMKKAYEAALSDIEWEQDSYNRAQIKYIFNK